MGYGLVIIQGCGGHGVSGLDDGGGKKRRANLKKSDANRGVCASQVGLDIPLERTLDPSTVTGVELGGRGTARHA